MNSKNIFKSIFVIFAFVFMTTNVFASCEEYKDWKSIYPYYNQKANDVGLRVTEMSINEQDFVAKTTGLCDKDYHYFAIVFYNKDAHPISTINSKISEIMYHEAKMDTIAKGKIPREFNRNYCFLDYGSDKLTSPLNCTGDSKSLFSTNTSAKAPVVFFGKIKQNTTDEMTYSIKTSKILAQLKDRNIKTYADLISNYDSVVFYVTRYNKGVSGLYKDVGDNTASQTGWKHEYLAQMPGDKSCFTYTQLKIFGKGNGVWSMAASGATAGAIAGGIAGSTVPIIGTLAGAIVGAAGGAIGGAIGGGIADIAGADVAIAKSNLFLRQRCMFSGPNLEVGYKVASLNRDSGQQPPSINDVPSAPSEEPSAPSETPSDPSEVGSDTTEDQVEEPVAPQQVNLDFTVYSSIPDISYSTTTATQYKARKVNDQEAYLIDYRNNKKEISVNLSSLNYTRPVYAILATPDQSDKIYGYLANIKSTGEFKDYTLQTNFTVNSNTLATSPVTMKYTMGSDKTFKFSIDPNVNDKFVLIFMQLSDDGSLINLTYTNLYNLDHNTQSIYQLCEINRNIVNFYCKGYDCKVPGNCIDRWDFDPSKLDGVSGIPVDAIPGTPTTPKPPVETPPATPTPPVSQDTTLAKGSDGCYTTNPETLAKIRSTNIGISKTIFPNRRTTSSIVSPGTADGTDDDPSITMEQINKIANMNTAKFSPDPIFKDSANSIYNLALLYNVDPIYALAIFRQEKSMYNTKAGNWGTDLTTTSKNPTSIMVSNNGYCACGGSRYTNNYCRYPTLDAGFEAFFININSRLYRGKTLTVAGSYWRYGISTNTTYGNSIKGHMDWIYNNAK